MPWRNPKLLTDHDLARALRESKDALNAAELRLRWAKKSRFRVRARQIAAERRKRAQARLMLILQEKAARGA